MKQRGELPFKERLVGEAYLTDSERHDVGGPESYFQYRLVKPFCNNKI